MLIVSFWVCIAKHARNTQSNKFTISLQHLKENVKDEVDFLPADKHQRFLQIDTIILGVCGQILQNNKFAISLQYLKKKFNDEVDFLHADKHESLLQINIIILMGMVKHSQSSQNRKFAMSLRYLKNEVRDEVDFLHADIHQSFLQVDFITLGIKVSYKVILSLLMGMIKHSQSTQSNKCAISLQYPKKGFRNEVHFLHADKHQSFCKLALSFLMEMVRHVQSTQNTRLVIFLQHIKKKVSQLLLCSIVM